MSEEFEMTLRVCAQEPESLFRSVAALRSLGPYELLEGKTAVMHDRYFDTPGRDLMKKGFALRLRTEGQRPLLCLKGHERINEWGAINRLEIEGPWSEEIMGRVIRSAGIAPCEGISFRPEDPHATLLGLGLHVIQSRDTERTILNVLPPYGPRTRAVGEIALDRVNYRVADKVFVHHEIEIEAVSRNREGEIRDLAFLLQKAFPGALCRWDHNKLITGFALEEIAGLSRSPSLSGKAAFIPEEWYGKIDDIIGKYKGNTGKTDITRS